MNKHKALLADANFSCLPILKSLHNYNYQTMVCGALSTDPCHKLAHESLLFDYSDKDELLQNALTNELEFLIPGCNDTSYLSCTYVAQKLKLPGYDNYNDAVSLHFKDKFRQLANNKGYPTPKSTNRLENCSSLSYPILVKPIDSFSGRGICKVTNEADLAYYYQHSKKHSPQDQTVFEEFIEGTLHSHSAFIKKGEIIIDFFVDEFCTMYEYQVNSSCLSYKISEPIKLKLRAWCKSLALDLNLADGLIHTQFIKNGDSFWIIEVTRRCPGDLYSELVKKSTGIDYSDLYIRPFLGLELPDNLSPKHTKYIARHTASRNQPCVLLATSIGLPNTSYQFVSTTNAGNIMKEAPFGKSGIFFIEFSTERALIETTPQLKDYVTFSCYDIEDFKR